MEKVSDVLANGHWNPIIVPDSSEREGDPRRDGTAAHVDFPRLVIWPAGAVQLRPQDVGKAEVPLTDQALSRQEAW